MKDNSQISILRLVDDYPVSGEATFGLQPVFLNLSREQKKLGYDVTVIARRHAGQPEYENDAGIQIRRLSSPFSPNALQSIRSLVTSKQHPILHPHATTGFFLAPLKKAIRAPIVSHVHGTTRSHYMPIALKFGRIVYDYSPLKIAYYQSREKLLWSAADKIVTVSNAIKSDLISSYRMNGEKINVVYNGVDTSIFRPVHDAKLPVQFKSLEGKRIVLYVGHFGLRKGILHLIRAMKKVVREVPDAALLCIGGVPKWLGSNDYWAFLRAAIKESDLEQKVILSDRLPNADLPRYYTLASVFVLPSYYEAFAKVAIEAMACERSVIVSRKGGLEEVVDDGKSGLLFEYGNVDELAHAIIALLQDDRKARLMGEYGRRRVVADFTWYAVVRRIEKVYDSIYNES
ncbi:MAG: glycosyltransferase family 4 protein [Thaumarchaeota archaeon]|nr:glycosyltransferase family 4 protein [Nitrososphaerota archaeon]